MNDLPRDPHAGFVHRLGIGVIAIAALFIAGCDRDAASTRGGQAEKPAAENVGWPGYSNTHDGQRFARLDQINTSNVEQLKTVCELKLGEEGPFQTGPVVIGDTMFLTTAHTTVAMDSTTCAVHWRHVDASGQRDPISVNRGLAYLDGRVFRGMPGARLAALDAKSGKIIWDVKVGDLALGEFVSSAPVAWNGIVYVGLAGGDWGIRGRVMGFDATTGRELWRFYTIPMGSEPEQKPGTSRIPQSAAAVECGRHTRSTRIRASYSCPWVTQPLTLLLIPVRVTISSPTR